MRSIKSTELRGRPKAFVILPSPICCDEIVSLFLFNSVHLITYCRLTTQVKDDDEEEETEDEENMFNMSLRIIATLMLNGSSMVDVDETNGNEKRKSLMLQGANAEKKLSDAAEF